MSHEIRTPMNGVLGMAELLSRSPLNAEQQRQLSVIRSSGRGLLRVIDDILDFAKLEANQMMLSVQPFNPVELTYELSVLFQARAEQSAVALLLVAPTALPKVLLGDVDRVRQIMVNLLGNAFKFTQQGSVTLQVECSTPDADGMVTFCFEVSDTGVGISAADQQLLFQDFVQVGTSTQHIHGTGLGLVISRDLINMMDGELTVQSELGKGSTFRVTLPLHVGDAAAAAAAEPPQSVAIQRDAPQRIKVLLVEDNEANQLVSEAMLKELGCEITIVENGLLAIDEFMRLRPDLILMDCNMPVMDGFESTRRIRQLEQDHGLPMTPIVAVTAHVLEEVRQQCFEAGMDEHISKPFSLKQIREILRQYLPA
jgi:CheY-like chemotaxis protein